MENSMMTNNMNGLSAALGTGNAPMHYYVSFALDTNENRAMLVNALGAGCQRVKDHVNETINLRDFILQDVEVVDQNSGEVSQATRIILIDENKTAYACTSIGVKNAIKALVMAYGEPATWKEAIPVKVVQISRGVNNILSLQIL